MVYLEAGGKVDQQKFKPDGLNEERLYQFFGRSILHCCREEYIQVKLDSRLDKGWNLPSFADKDERIKFENKIVVLVGSFGILIKYHSFTPDHKYQIKNQQADELSNKYFLFNDMITDIPQEYCIQISENETKIIWDNEEDQLRIITKVQGNYLKKVDISLSFLQSFLVTHVWH